jgi:hypothetical protein
VIAFTPESVVVDQATVKPDGNFMFTAHLADNPAVLYAYDKVGLKEDCDGGWFLEFTMQVVVAKDTKPNEEGLDAIGQNLIQYLFEMTTKDAK